MTFQRSQALRGTSTRRQRHPGADGSQSMADLGAFLLGVSISHSIVQVTTRDESEQITAHGMVQLPSGMLAPDGPAHHGGPSCVAEWQ